MPLPRLAAFGRSAAPAGLTGLACLAGLACLVWPCAAAAQAPLDARVGVGVGVGVGVDAAPAGCALLWQVAVRLDTRPRRLQIGMAFDAGPRGRSTLRLPGGWAGVDEQVPAGGAARLQAVAADATLRTVAHAPGERVQLRWRLTPPTGPASGPPADRASDARADLPGDLPGDPPADPFTDLANDSSTDLASGWAAQAGSGGKVQLAATWFALAGQAVLPLPDETDERQPVTACIAFTGLTTAPGSAAPAVPRWASSHGIADGPTALYRLPASPLPLRQRVQQALYAGGALDLWPPDGAAPATTGAASAGATLTVVRPSAPAWGFGINALAQATAQALADQRLFWGDAAPAPTAATARAAARLANTTANTITSTSTSINTNTNTNTNTTSTTATPPLLVLLLPGAAAPAASAWHQALALQAPTRLALPGADFDALITQAVVRTWVPDRFGPLVHAGRQDEALRAWFRDGFAAYYAHRLLLRDGRWTPADYASVLNRQIEHHAEHSAAQRRDAAASGEWLALQWHSALRAQGQPGLDAVLRRLLLPSGQARREGPISAPLATHRLVAALRPQLGDAPLRDINRLAQPGAPLNPGAQSLGPCFEGQPVAPSAGRPPGQRYRPVAQALQQPACLGWLGLTPEADARAPAQAPSAGPKSGKSASTVGKAASKSAGKATSKKAQPRKPKAGAKAAKATRHPAPAR